MSDNFSEWLQNELNMRDWSQRELVRRVRAKGHKLTSSQLSRLITTGQGGTVEVIIAISDGLGLPREEVFRIKGWLLNEPRKVFEPGTDPRLLSLSERLKDWPPNLQDAILDLISAQADAIDMATGKRNHSSKKLAVY